MYNGLVTKTRKHGIEVWVAILYVDGNLKKAVTHMSEAGAWAWLHKEGVHS
jgi:hypothetical protein